MKVFKKFLSIFLINLLVFYQMAFYVPVIYAQEATPTATKTPTPTLTSTPEPTLVETPSPTPTIDPSPTAAPSTTPEPTPTATPNPTPSAIPTPSPTPEPSPEIINETETPTNASLKTRQAPIEKKVRKVSSKNYVEGQVLVKFRENKINLKQPSNMAKAKQFAAAKNLELEDTIEKNNVAVLEITGTESVEAAVTRLESDSTVQDAQPNFIYKPTAINSNDTYRNELWGLDNTGQTVNSATGTNDADVDGPEAWDLSEGNNIVIVAVIDNGVAYNHPDLQSAMWDGSACKDDEGNTLGSCNYGYDFEDNDKTPLPYDTHGTHVAGTIAATKNNSLGIVGVAPGVRIMALKTGFTTTEIIRAVNFARYNGAKIINASFGGESDDPLLEAAIESFDGLFVAAAGNNAANNESNPFYPCNFDSSNIVCVAATDQNDNLASFSNYGVASVDVAAPGVNIYSTIPDILSSEILNETFDDLTAPDIPNGWLQTSNWGTYDFEDGVWGKVLYGDVNNPTYASNANDTVISATYNLSGATGAEINFWAVCDTEYTTSSWDDYMALEVSSNGGADFTELLRWDEAYLDNDTTEGNHGNATVAYLTEHLASSLFTSGFQFRLRWVSDSDSIKGTGDGCYVDDILITKYILGSTELYDYFDGTSMATPHVAGIAALVWSYNSARTYSQVKSIILNTGDTKDFLVGKTVTGKRVNAYNALLSTTPTVTELSNDSNPTKSKAWNWSSTDPTATFRFAIDQSTSWTPTGDYSSTATATQNSGDGTYYIHVQAKNSSGIESEVVTVSVILDNTAPTTPGTLEPSPSSPTNQTTQTWTWDASTDVISELINYIWSIINGTTDEVVNNGTTTDTSLGTNLSEGIWNFIVGAQDSAGNESEVAGASVTVDGVASH